MAAFVIAEVIQAFFLDRELLIEGVAVVFVIAKPPNLSFVAAPTYHPAESIADGTLGVVNNEEAQDREEMSEQHDFASSCR